MLKVPTVRPGRGSDQLPEDPYLLAEWLSPHWQLVPQSSTRLALCPLASNQGPLSRSLGDLPPTSRGCGQRQD